MALYQYKYYKELSHVGGQSIILNIFEKVDVLTNAIAIPIGNVVVSLEYGIQARDVSVDTAIQKTSLTMSFIDAPEKNKASEKWGGWEEFYTPDSTKYKVELEIDGVVRWTGFITPDSYEEDLRYHAAVSFTARDNWGRLSDFQFDAQTDNDLISIRDLIQMATDKAGVEMPVIVNTNAIWPVCNGIPLYEHLINVKAFEGDTWWDAVEGTLSSLGMVITYEDNNRFILSPMRARMFKGYSSYASVPKTPFKFEASGHRSMAPACREIVEKQDYDISQDLMNVKEMTVADFVSGGGYPFTTQPYGTVEDVATVFATSSSSFWKTGTDGEYSSALNPFNYPSRSGDDDVYLHDGKTLYLATNPGTAEDYSVADTLMKGVYCEAPMTKMKADIRFLVGKPVRLYDDRATTGIAPWDESQTCPAIARIVAKITYTTASGVVMMWNGDEWVEGEEFVNLTPQGDGEAQYTTEYIIPSPEIDERGTLRIHFRCGYYIIFPNYHDDGRGMYMPIQGLSLQSTRKIYGKNLVNTKYVESNNVIIERNPTIGCVNFDTICPYEVLNGVYSPSAGYPASRVWKWSDATDSNEHQLPVLIHTQILPYFARPMNILTGTIIKNNLLSLPSFAELWNYDGVDYLLMSGRVDLLSGRMVNAELREYIIYEDIWADTFPSSTINQSIYEDSESQDSSDAQQTNNISLNGGGSSTLEGLKDVSLTTLSGGQSLVWDDVKNAWVNKKVSGGGGDAALEADVTAEVAVGYISKNSTLIEGMTFTEFVQMMFSQDIKKYPPTVTLEGVPNYDIEVGTSVVLNLTSLYKDGYFANTKDGTTQAGCEAGTATFHLDNAAIEVPYTLATDSAKVYAVSVRQPYGASTAEVINKAGQTVEESISAGTATAQQSFTVGYRAFWGYMTDDEAENLTSELVRGLEHQDTIINPSQSVITLLNEENEIPAGEDLIIAIPEGYALQSVIDKTTSQPIKFEVPTTLAVECGSASQNYKVYRYDNYNEDAAMYITRITIEKEA